MVCDEVVGVSSPEAAELTKLLENVFRSVNIALVNELAMLTDRMGIDVWEVVEAAATKPYGFMRFEPGPGMGGHCLPVDPFYLSWRAREFDMVTEFVELAGKINQQMPYHCVAKAQRALNDRGLAVKGARIAVIGVSYKPGVGDVRESPALKIIGLLRELGAEVGYHDPHVPDLPELGLTSSPFDQAIADADLALIVTAHPSVDHDADRPPGTTGGRSARRHALGRRRQRREAVSGDGPAAPGREPLLGEDVAVGEDVRFGAFVVVHDGTSIGAGCTIGDHAVLGKRPVLARHSAAAGDVGGAGARVGRVVGDRRGRLRRRPGRRRDDPGGPELRARARHDRRRHGDRPWQRGRQRRRAWAIACGSRRTST